MAEFIPQASNTTGCADEGITGPFSSKYDYLLKATTGDPNYPAEACTPWIQYPL